ncbi:MAG: SUMF1/EgtB/PvdO family nonheme iron enzyme [Candidatus Eremiobacteraeota bacterium]|nr:SUMF1/EgtB/PvdO family nonheme iron enzyme [Candidatus Eremiobacteraeota bacterium]
MAELAEARARTLALASDLADEQLIVPRLDIINPILWELGHIAYFAEFWILRGLLGRAPMIENADQLYDSAKVAHDDRWTLPLPSREQTLDFMRREFEAISECSRELNDNADAQYFYRLVLHHEDMHAEALTYTRQTLGYAVPAYATATVPGSHPLPGDVRVSGGRYYIGARPSDGFVFDNEKWAHEVELGAFNIARAPVTNAEFLAFVEAGGYAKSALWSAEGWMWREKAGADRPIYWAADLKTRRSFDHEIPLSEHEPVCNVNYYEAQAFCAWNGRRLPTEAEWEVAATGGQPRRYPWGDQAPHDVANTDAVYGGICDVGAFEDGESPTGCRQMIGNVWEWTSSAFGPYPGFSPDPYKEYSEPWFGTHQVLRGGAWTTRARLISTRWRNFYQPSRRDIMTGFRTVKL